MANKATFEQVVSDNNYQTDKRHNEFEGQMKHFVKVSKENDKSSK